QQQQIHSPVTALSPQQAAREKARVTVLLDINSALLQEVVSLQASGKAGVAPTQLASHQSSPIKENNATSPTSPTDIAGSQSQNPGSTEGSKPASKPSIEYIDCMRRLQANLAYLATVADRAKKSGAAAPQAPAIMSPPPNVPGVADLYTKLNELFAGVSRTGGGGPSTPQQQQQQRQSTGPQPSSHGTGAPIRVSPAQTLRFPRRDYCQSPIEALFIAPSNIATSYSIGLRTVRGRQESCAPPGSV
ncbi:hypothetical protein ACJ72_02327, partial [Emergomyces africanus]